MERLVKKWCFGEGFVCGELLKLLMEGENGGD